MATRGKQSKAGRQVPTFRIAVLGPSFVGKTQIVNRIVNNNFFAHYIPTEEKEVYKIFYNSKGPGSAPEFVWIELHDCFPQDHPFLFIDSSSISENTDKN